MTVTKICSSVLFIDYDFYFSIDGIKLILTASLKYIIMIALTVKQVVTVPVTVINYSSMILLILICSCDVMTKEFLQTNAVAVL